MVIRTDSYSSAGYQQQAYAPQGGWYPEAGYHQGHAQGLQVGYDKPSPPHTSPEFVVDGGHTCQHGYGYKPDSVFSSNPPTHYGVGAYKVPGTGWGGNSPPFPVYGQYPGNGYAYWSGKGV